ncbi:phosphomannose isomerase type II C-terminal cupin domain [Patescibacteria group bacterium]|nr:phosphomannose isomerase type II C-terminal cupin domain [Patescibacteria group bacterium]
MDDNTVKKYTEERPWGKFERFTFNQKSTVKILTIKPNEKLSLQYHENRSEFWKILSGEGKITLEETIKNFKEGDEFYVPIGTKHTAESLGVEIIILEIAFGHFDEDDIIRLADKYGREHQQKKY